MVQITWTDLAREDLRAIFDYISIDSPQSAQKVVETIIQKVDVLLQFPEMGRTVPEFGDSTIRELISGSYRIVYLIEEGQIYIARIHHSARILTDI